MRNWELELQHTNLGVPISVPTEGLVKKDKVLWLYFTVATFSLPLHDGIFLQSSKWTWCAGGKTNKSMRTPWQYIAPLEFLTLKLVLSEPPVCCQLQFRFSCPNSGSSSSALCFWASAPARCDTLCPPLSNLGDGSLLCDLLSQMDPKRPVDFQFVQLFFLWGWNWSLFSSLHARLETRNLCPLYGQNYLWIS